MLKIHVLALGDYRTNCYIIYHSESKTCCILDPGDQANLVERQVTALGLTPEAILLTHSHFDHVGAVKQLAAGYDCRVYIHPEELSMPVSMTAGKLYHTHTYSEGDILELAGLTIRVLHTPGHTPGSVCLMVEDALFTGDTLFAGSCGRTDLPGGRWGAILSSLRRLGEIQADYRVFPGHGESTTLAEEKLYNPFMK